MIRGRVVLWGARSEDIQFGSQLDLRREALRGNEARAMQKLGGELVAMAQSMAVVGEQLGRTLSSAMNALQEPARRRLNREIQADLDFGRD